MEVGWLRAEQSVQEQMFRTRWVFGAAHVLRRVGSAVIAAHSWRNNFGKHFVDYPRCNMKTSHEEQRKAHRAEMAHVAGMVVDPVKWPSSRQMGAAAVGSVSQKARTVSESALTVLVV